MRSLLLCFLLLRLSALSAQGNLTASPGLGLRSAKAKTLDDVIVEFKHAVGEREAAMTNLAERALIYITCDRENVELYATTNFRFAPTETQYRVATLSGMLDPRELLPLFQAANPAVDVTALPLLVDNEVFTLFANLDFLKTFAHTSVISKGGRRFSIRHGLAELKPDVYAQLAVNLEKLQQFLYERPYPHGSVRVLSLLNNETINNVFSAAYPNFQAVRTVNQIEKAIAKSGEPVIFVVGHLQGTQLIRYRQEGSVSYELPVKQFQTMAQDLKKEIVLIGCNYADNPGLQPPKSQLNVAAEIKLLADALRAEQFGDLFQQLVKTGQDSVVVRMGLDHKIAGLQRRAGDQTAMAYNFIFFDTRPRPALAAQLPRLLFRYAGFGFLAVALFQALCFWVFRFRAAGLVKWINWGLLLFFAACYVLAPLLGAG